MRRLPWKHAGMLKTILPFLCLFFSQRVISIFANYFFLISSICFPLLYLLQKSPNNYFFDKVSTVLFFSFTYFSYFSWVWRLFYFFDFFSSGFGGRHTVEAGEDPDWLIFAVWHGVWELLNLKPFFPSGHVTPHCWSHWWIFMGVFCSFDKLTQWLVDFLWALADILNFVF